MFKVKIYVNLKRGVADPQGITIKDALYSLNYKEVEEVRMGKYIQLKMEGISKEKVEKKVNEMCQKLLVNPVIEEYTYQIEELK